MVIHGTLAGRAYSDLQQHTSTTPLVWTTWTTVLDGADRLGVLQLDFPQVRGEPEPKLLENCHDVQRWSLNWS
jgi:hypothetical protein